MSRKVTIRDGHLDEPGITATVRVVAAALADASWGKIDAVLQQKQRKLRDAARVSQCGATIANPTTPPSYTSAPCCCADLYNAAARHYAWMKHAKEEQKTNWRVWLYLILEEPSTSSAATVFAVASALMILLQVVTIMLESGSFGAQGVTCVEDDETTCALTPYDITDICLSVLFTVELVLRSICATSMRELTTSVFWWIDLFGVAPFYLQLILDAVLSGVPHGLAAVRSLLRLLRIVRVLKVLRQHPDSEILYRALQMSARPLVVPFTFLVIGTPPAARRTPPPRLWPAAKHTRPVCGPAAPWPTLRPCGPPCGRRDLLRRLRLLAGAIGIGRRCIRLPRHRQRGLVHAGHLQHGGLRRRPYPGPTP